MCQRRRGGGGGGGGGGHALPCIHNTSLKGGQQRFKGEQMLLLYIRNSPNP